MYLINVENDFNSNMKIMISCLHKIENLKEHFKISR